MHRLHRQCLHRPAWALWAASDAQPCSIWRACQLFSSAPELAPRERQPLPDAHRPERPLDGTRGWQTVLKRVCRPLVGLPREVQVRVCMQALSTSTWRISLTAETAPPPTNLQRVCSVARASLLLLC